MLPVAMLAMLMGQQVSDLSFIESLHPRMYAESLTDEYSQYIIGAGIAIATTNLLFSQALDGIDGGANYTLVIASGL